MWLKTTTGHYFCHVMVGSTYSFVKVINKMHSFLSE